MLSGVNKKDVKQSLSECWSSVRDKVEFAENCMSINQQEIRDQSVLRLDALYF